LLDVLHDAFKFTSLLIAFLIGYCIIGITEPAKDAGSHASRADGAGEEESWRE